MDDVSKSLESSQDPNQAPDIPGQEPTQLIPGRGGQAEPPAQGPAQPADVPRVPEEAPPLELTIDEPLEPVAEPPAGEGAPPPPWQPPAEEVAAPPPWEMVAEERPAEAQPMPPPPPPVVEAAPLSPSDERTWAMLAHMSVLLNLVTGFLGVVAALVIYLVYKDRSRYVAYQSLQSLLFQAIAWLGGGVIAFVAWFLSSILAAVFIGFLCMPIACLISLLPLGAVVYGIVGAVECSKGQDFRYWLVGDWTRDMMGG